jgi:general secretion pathway protein H
MCFATSHDQTVTKHPLGMTLIEIMIVVAIIGGIMALATYVMFPSDDAKVRDEANRLAGTIKFVYNEAAIKNKYYRLVYHLEEGTYLVESSTEPFHVAIEGEEGKTASSPPPKEGGEAAEGGEAPAGEGGGFAVEEGLMVKPVKLPTGVKFKDIYVMHSPERMEFGTVYSYFLPNGWAEPVVINLADEDEKSFYSLEVNPLTGKSTIRTEYYEVNPEKFRNPEGAP